MSDERELVERLATIDATPRARWVAEFRADLNAAWETEDPGYLDSLRTTTVTLVENEPTPSEPSSGRRWVTLIAAAAAVVLVVGVFVVFDRDEAPPADQPSSTVTVPPTTPPRALPNGSGIAQCDSAGDVLRRRGRRNTDAADLRHPRRRVDDNSGRRVAHRQERRQQDV